MKYIPQMLCWMLALTTCAKSGAREPVIGGPCENCDLVFVGMPDQVGSMSRIAPASQPGEPLIIEGRVRDLRGQPAAGIVVYAYHTDAGGIYPRAETQHGKLRGWAKTDSAGDYQFSTIRPGPYPGGTAPEHVHMHIIEPGRGTYWIGDINFDDDPLLWDKLEGHRTVDRGGFGICTPSRDSAGVWHARRDIELGQGIPGYPAFPADSAALGD